MCGNEGGGVAGGNGVDAKLIPRPRLQHMKASDFIDERRAVYDDWCWMSICALRRLLCKSHHGEDGSQRHDQHK
jgi:hypothetical protein